MGGHTGGNDSSHLRRPFLEPTTGSHLGTALTVIFASHISIYGCNHVGGDLAVMSGNYVKGNLGSHTGHPYSLSSWVRCLDLPFVFPKVERSLYICNWHALLCSQTLQVLLALKRRIQPKKVRFSQDNQGGKHLT